MQVPTSFVPRPNADEVAATFRMPLLTFLQPPAGTHSTEDILYHVRACVSCVLCMECMSQGVCSL